MWEKIVKNLSQKLTRPQFESWIVPIKYLNMDENNIYLAVPDEYYKNWINKNLSQQIKEAISQETGTFCGLVLDVDESLRLQERASRTVDVFPKENQSIMKPCEKRFHPQLNQKYTFDTFVESNGNSFAYSMARSVAERLGSNYNPLFIYGGVGLGKTHLMQAIAHEVYNLNPEKKIKYVSMENFTNDFIDSLRRKTSSDFRNRYRKIDLLLLDDVQFLEGKESTQDELFNTFNDLHEAGKQIVLSSDRPPKSIKKITERLTSRFEWGVIVDIQPPDLETRMAILTNKANADRMNIPLDVIELIASTYQNNVRALEGALNRVIAYVSVTGSPMTVQGISSLIDVTSNAQKLTPAIIVDVVAEFFKISAADIKGSSRMKDISRSRQIAIYLTRERTRLSFPAIAEFYGKKHSTIMHSYNKIKEEVSLDRSFAGLVSELSSKLT